jgi:hypothetical protein
MLFAIKCVEIADGRPSQLVAGKYLMCFDFEGEGGRGVGLWTADQGEAMTFETAADAMLFWRTQSKTVPLRADGKPNRPLTAFTVEVARVEP